jgi:hypothetical protein
VTPKTGFFCSAGRSSGSAAGGLRLTGNAENANAKKRPGENATINPP